MVASPIKWAGGKAYLAKKIVGMMGEHCHYCEPYAGSMAVLFAKNPEGCSEVVNDLHVDLSNFWCVLQNKPLFEVFARIMQATPFSQVEFDAAMEDPKCVVEPDITYELATGLNDPRGALAVAKACGFFVRCRQSMAGMMKSFAPLSRNRLRSNMNEQASAWLTAVEGLPAVHARLKRVVILNRPALEVIRGQDGEKTLFYADPPYLHETRTTKDLYDHEMTYEDHEEMLEVLLACKGKVMLSGYPNDLYDSTLKGWRRVSFDLPNNAASGKEKRRMTEVLWLNY